MLPVNPFIDISEICNLPENINPIDTDTMRSIITKVQSTIQNPIKIVISHDLISIVPCSLSDPWRGKIFRS